MKKNDFYYSFNVSKMEISDIDPANIEFRLQEAPDENSDYCVMKSLLDGKSISIKLPMKKYYINDDENDTHSDNEES